MPSYRNPDSIARTVTYRPVFNAKTKKFSGKAGALTIPARSLFTYSSQYPEVAAMFGAQMTGWAPAGG